MEELTVSSIMTTLQWGHSERPQEISLKVVKELWEEELLSKGTKTQCCHLLEVCEKFYNT